MRSLLVRSLVALIGIPALLWVFYHGGWWVRGLSSLLIMLGVWEARTMAAVKGAGFPWSAAAVLALLVPWYVWPHGGEAWPAWIALILLTAATPRVWSRRPEAAALASTAMIVTVLWLGIGFGALVALRGLHPEQGFLWLLFLFMNLWIGDTAAYAFGTWLGRTKLSPAISPNKTVAGAVSQVIVGGLIGVAFAATGWIPASPSLLVYGAVMIAVVGQIGDLFESILKRTAGCKDSSTIIPGHGGVLDRFDSMLLAAPALWVMIRLWPA